jgi:hypothetical protein
VVFAGAVALWAFSAELGAALLWAAGKRRGFVGGVALRGAFIGLEAGFLSGCGLSELLRLVCQLAPQALLPR